MDTGNARRFLQASAASAILDAQLRNNPAGRIDPSAGIPGMPPNFGRQIVPHVVTFPGLTYQLANVYRNPDQAVYSSKYNARAMWADLSVRGPLIARQRACSLLDLAVVPEDKSSKVQKDWCARLQSIIMHTNRFLRFKHWLMQGIWFGRCATQNSYGWDSVNGKPAIVIRKWSPVHGDKLVFRFDGCGPAGSNDSGQVGLRVAPQAITNGLIDIGGQKREVELANDYGYAYFFKPWERSLVTLHQHEIEDASFEESIFAGSVHGIGIRSQIYQTWVLKQETMGALVDFIDRVGQGFTVAYFDSSNPKDEQRVRDMANSYDGRSWILFPRPLGDDKQTHGIERIEPSAAGIDALRVLVDEYFGTQIMQFILGQTSTMRAESQGLGNENKTHEISFYQVVKFDATNLEDTLTSDLLEPLKQFNIPQARNVNLRIQLAVDSPKVKDQLEALGKAYEMGAKIPARQVCELVGIAEPGEGEEVLQNPQFAQAQAQAGAGGLPPGMTQGTAGQPDPAALAKAEADIRQQTQQVLEQAFGMEATPEEDAELASDQPQAAEQYAEDDFDGAEDDFDQAGLRSVQSIGVPRADSVARDAIRKFTMPPKVRRAGLSVPIQVAELPEMSWDGHTINIPAGLEAGEYPALMAHALAHAVDRGQSESPEWQQAWADEIQGGDLSDYAAASPTEGWAEFGRLAWLLPKDARESFPLCWNAWEQAGMVGEGKPGTALVPASPQPARYSREEAPMVSQASGLRDLADRATLAAKVIEGDERVERLEQTVKALADQLRESNQQTNRLLSAIAARDTNVQITTPAPNITVDVPQQAAPQVSVPVTVTPSTVAVEITTPAPKVEVTVEAPVVNAPVTVQMPEKRPAREVTIRRTDDGLKGSIEDAK